MFSKEYASKDIDEQLRYMEAFHFLMFLKERDLRGEAGGKRGQGAACGNVGCLLIDAKKPGLVSPEDVRELEDLKREFEAKLKEHPQRYPLGVFFNAHRLNALERYMVTAVASAILFGPGSWEGSETDLRRLARLYHDSPRKRLEAEFYFTHECKLFRKRIMYSRKKEFGGLARSAPTSKMLDMYPWAYRALMGRSGSSVEGPRKERPSSSGSREVGEELGEVLEPRIGLDRVVLPPEALEEIRSAVALEKNREVLFDTWGLGDQAVRGRGVSMLFHGPPGTGKTLTAEAVARELGRKLLWVSGSDLVSKWHGEDERRTAAVFRRAKAEKALLLFDEADSFFFARHEVRHSTDVSDNRTVNVILGCLEGHDLPVVLTTNRADVLDPALERRLTLKVAFPVPGPEERERIWRLHLPPELPLAEDVDIARLARVYELAGGNIKNAVMAAARRAIARAKNARSARVTMRDLERACRDECEGVVISGGGRRKVGFTA